MKQSLAFGLVICLFGVPFAVIAVKSIFEQGDYIHLLVATPFIGAALLNRK